MRPCVNSLRLGVADDLEHLYNTFPNRFPFKRLFHRHAFNMRSLNTVQLTNHVSQFLNIAHDVASTSWPTVQKSFSIPAAIAGVQRNVLWRRTKL